MKCPYCAYAETQVRDSRPSDENISIRRRRYCPDCGGRFTTFERAEMHDLVVIKSDGRKEQFDLEKLKKSLVVALIKRPFTLDDIRSISQTIRSNLEQEGNNEITSKHIGQCTMDYLKRVDPIGYVRFASVYKNFTDVSDFLGIITMDQN